MLVEGTDVPRGMDYRQAARKAVAMCVSDFASKGVKPEYFMVSLGLRRGVTDSQVRDLGLGFRDAEKEWGVHLVGGDTNEASELVIDCAMVGFAKKYVPRKGARPGDIIVVTGNFGYPPSGLLLLDGKGKASDRFAQKAKDSALMPRPNLKVGIALGRYLSSAMDSSDGLARSLHTLASASGFGLRLESLPVGDGVRQFAKDNKIDWEGLVLRGGEEYVIVGTVPKSRFRAADAAARRAGGKLIPIGRVLSVKGKVELVAGLKTKVIADEGWTHLG